MCFTPEDLILLKLDAGGPQDILDVRALLAAKPSELDIERLKRGAAQLRLQTLLDSCLSDRPKKKSFTIAIEILTDRGFSPTRSPRRD